MWVEPTSAAVGSTKDGYQCPVIPEFIPTFHGHMSTTGGQKVADHRFVEAISESRAAWVRFEVGFSGMQDRVINST